jgi:tetratricopeptide (TPR) repeat protein
MVPETGVGADHNWPQRMTMTTTNVEILRQGWLDAASALAPGLDTLPEFLEHGLEAAVIDERLDEQSLLRVVTEVTSAAADSLPAEELYFLTRRLQRAVYEYLLSLDALPEPPVRRDGNNGNGAQDTTLIGAEEVAALGRNGHTKTVAEPVHAPKATPKPAPEPKPTTTPAAETAPEPAVETQPDPDAIAAAADRVEAGLAELDSHLSPDDFSDPEPEPEPEVEEAEPAPEPVSTRPAFTLFRRNGTAASKTITDTDATAPVEPDAPASNGKRAAEHAAPTTNGSSAHAAPAAEDADSFVKPKDGFHLSDLADFAVVQRAETAPVEPEAEAPAEIFDEVAVAPAPEFTAAEPEPEPEIAPAQPAREAASGAAARGWRLRDDDADQAHDLNADTDTEDSRFETDPEVVEARLEINDRLRRRRCDEAAALLQRLANDVGGRALAELALDAGDRCRALGKGNAALSCYLAASRADPVHETPLLRLADICIDDHDIDLAVSYLERVTRLRRLRNDDKGALKLYRKIVTIAPYRDDILAMLMRAQANGRFDE